MCSTENRFDSNYLRLDRRNFLHNRTHFARNRSNLMHKKSKSSRNRANRLQFRCESYTQTHSFSLSQEEIRLFEIANVDIQNRVCRSVNDSVWHWMWRQMDAFNANSCALYFWNSIWIQIRGDSAVHQWTEFRGKLNIVQSYPKTQRVFAGSIWNFWNFQDRYAVDFFA